MASGANHTVIPFFNSLETIINYTQSYKDQYGDLPKVEVVYWDNEALAYKAAGIFTSVALDGYPVDLITVNHGGQSIGFIKLSRN